MIPAINLDYTFDFETMYTSGDVGSLQAHNVANDEMQVFEANDEMQVFATNDEMQVFEANDEMQVFEEMSDHADTMHTSVATGATTATANTISSQDSGTDDSEVPYLILTFNSEEEARAHYNRYAKRVGFSIKINTARKSAKDGERDKVMFVCNKCGPEEKTGEAFPTKKRKISRTRQAACKARMTVKRKGARWEVIQFVEEHTHPLVRKFSLKKFLRSHRAIPKEEKDFITMLHGMNLSAGRIMKLMSELYGGARNVPYTRKDISNFKSKLGSEYRCRDIPEPIAHFEEIKKDDPNFFYKIQLDKEDRVQNIFWVDGAARNAYKDFKDCVSFDCTYMTNMYNMPCAPFIGINRHGQSLQVMTSDFVGQVSDIPEHYILPRWTMVKKPELPLVTSIGEQMQLPPESLKLIRYTNMCTKFTHIAKDASSNEKAYHMALQRTSSMTDDLAAMKQSRKKQKKAQPAPDKRNFRYPLGIN
ncbi:Os09g0105100 [Oryza sativa Japonica Group]|uniref:Os09g0105100 protein n=1 Tax=Oryza sativa subsp. japonica TaxID=39947 RepID=A0A0P0XJL4_ORYSJ|nr:Os09g0105100 [Oryza sativa Japonica Group]